MPALFALGDRCGLQRGGARHGPGVGGSLPGRSRPETREPSAEVCARGRPGVFRRADFLAQSLRLTSRCPRSVVARTILFLALILAVPLIVAANPVDASGQQGWYDDEDADRLVTQSMSPESMMGIATLVLGARFWGPMGQAGEPVRKSGMTRNPEPVPRSLLNP